MMNTSSIALKDRLMDLDPDFRHLVQKHRELDGEIVSLDERVLLTTEEKMKTVTLKKQKLQLKDQITQRLELFRREMEKMG